MKRTADQTPFVADKKLRSKSPANFRDPFHPDLEEDPSRLKSGSKYCGNIVGRVAAAYPVLDGTTTFKMETLHRGRVGRFEIVISESYYEMIEFQDGDLVVLSLTGAEVVDIKRLLEPHALSFFLYYHRGVIVKFLARAKNPEDDGEIIDIYNERPMWANTVVPANPPIIKQQTDPETSRYSWTNHSCGSTQLVTAQTSSFSQSSQPTPSQVDRPYGNYVLMSPHRLICDSSPDMQPNANFSCTVEVIYAFMNNNDICSVYVTDYTKVKGGQKRVNRRIPDALSEYTLKIEFFGEMRGVGQNMMSGEIYCLENVFLKASKGHWTEGMFDHRGKLRKMNEEVTDSHVQALMKRKDNMIRNDS